jgi:hypothetical protein
MYLADLKDVLSEKEIRNLDSEDKLTSLYMSIIDLKSRRERLLTNGKNGNIPLDELERIDRSIEKKYGQREKLMDKKEKGHFVVRTPYKYISDLLQIPEGNVSVQMMRAVDKMKAAL